MSFLAPLLAAQDLDLEVDDAHRREAGLPERQKLPVIAEKVAALDAELAGVRARRAELEAEEHALGEAVAEIVRALEAADLERYSGKRKDRDAAKAHDAAQQALREKQSGLEEQEMVLLETIEEVDARIVELESTIGGHRAAAAELTESLRQAVAEIQAEVARISEARAALVEKLPAEVLKGYERVRAQPRSGGRGATGLVDGRCTGCRIQLPSLEKRRMLAEPEDALLQCPQCRRVLVRE